MPPNSGCNRAVETPAEAGKNGFRVRFGAAACLRLVNMAESSSNAESDGPRQDEVDDRVLIEQFARGDRTAFDRIVLRHQDRVARLAWRLMGFSRDDDIVQDVFLAALTNLKKFRGQAALGTWLATITIRKCRSRQRQAAVRRRFLGSRWTREGGRARRRDGDGGRDVRAGARDDSGLAAAPAGSGGAAVPGRRKLTAGGPAAGRAAKRRGRSPAPGEGEDAGRAGPRTLGYGR